VRDMFVGTEARLAAGLGKLAYVRTVYSLDSAGACVVCVYDVLGV
jgi:hypothetical protein